MNPEHPDVWDLVHKPTPVKAMPFTGFSEYNRDGNGDDVLAWINANGGDALAEGREIRIRRVGLGDFWLTPGGVVIWGDDGGFYPSTLERIHDLYDRVQS